MERVVRKVNSFDEQREADRAYYRCLTPQQRLDILLEMAARHRQELGEAGDQFVRVCRVVDRRRR